VDSLKTMGTLYLVATPIGNLEDISPRALRTLSEVTIIAAEDTRHSRKLLNHYGIKTKVTSYHEHSKENKLGQLLTILDQGDVALISDAGTPTLNDPGYELVRAALEAGHKVSPIPGPSAPIAALVASGLAADRFLYLGYLPRRKLERRRLLKEIAPLSYTIIFLETPHRLLSALEDLEQILGNRQIAIARELTKLYEEIFRGTLQQAYTHFNEERPRGEFTLVLSGAIPDEELWSEDQLRAAIKERILEGEPTTQVANQVASQSGWPRREVYKLAAEIRNFKNPD
jgi:16S rRNA (cytidine1402-2'-O)-methyltransferase